MAAVCGGPHAAANAAVHPGSHGQLVGRRRVIFRAEVEMRAGMLTSLRRIVPLRALPRSALAKDPTARERLNAIVARTSQAALAVNTPDGRCASALSLRSTFICSMNVLGP